MEKFVNITPRFLRLVGPPGQPLSGSVTIVPEKKYDFKILQARAAKPQNIKVTLAPRPASEPGYILTVENLKETIGRYYDTIYLETDSKLQPRLQVKVYGNIIKAPKTKGTP